MATQKLAAGSSASGFKRTSDTSRHHTPPYYQTINSRRQYPRRNKTSSIMNGNSFFDTERYTSYSSFATKRGLIGRKPYFALCLLQRIDHDTDSSNGSAILYRPTQKTRDTRLPDVYECSTYWKELRDQLDARKEYARIARNSPQALTGEA